MVQIIHKLVKMAESDMVVRHTKQVEHNLQVMILLHIQVQVEADSTAVAVVLLVHHNLVLYQQVILVQVVEVQVITDTHK